MACAGFVLDTFAFRVEVIQAGNGSEFQPAFSWHLPVREIRHACIRPATPQPRGSTALDGQDPANASRRRPPSNRPRVDDLRQLHTAMWQAICVSAAANLALSCQVLLLPLKHLSKDRLSTSQ